MKLNIIFINLKDPYHHKLKGQNELQTAAEKADR